MGLHLKKALSNLVASFGFSEVGVFPNVSDGMPSSSCWRLYLATQPMDICAAANYDRNAYTYIYIYIYTYRKGI